MNHAHHFAAEGIDFEQIFPAELTELISLLNLNKEKSDDLAVSPVTMLPKSDIETKEENIRIPESLETVPTMEPREVKIQTENITNIDALEQTTYNQTKVAPKCLHHLLTHLLPSKSRL